MSCNVLATTRGWSAGRGASGLVSRGDTAGACPAIAETIGEGEGEGEVGAPGTISTSVGPDEAAAAAAAEGEEEEAAAAAMEAAGVRKRGEDSGAARNCDRPTHACTMPRAMMEEVLCESFSPASGDTVVLCCIALRQRYISDWNEIVYMMLCMKGDPMNETQRCKKEMQTSRSARGCPRQRLNVNRMDWIGLDWE